MGILSHHMAGLDAMRRRLTDLPVKARNATAGALKDVAEGVAADVRATLVETTQAGDGPSRPGTPPADRSGALAASVSVDSDRDGPRSDVTVAAPFAIFLEYGTVRMMARPFLRPLALRAESSAKTLLAAALRRGTRLMSAIDRQAQVVAAISAALQTDPAFAALVGPRVYDAPPARAVMPSVTIRLVSSSDDSTANTEAQRLVFDLDVWDRYTLGATLGRPRTVMGCIRRILHMQSMSIPSIGVLSILCTGTRGPFRDPDEAALHGVVTVTVAAGHETSMS